ncbi:hypothetical protein ACFV3E_06005 [Streptomyces sp. NPDC059718]
MAEAEWAQQAHYETDEGDRVTLLKSPDGEWGISWSYSSPSGSAQFVPYGGHGGEATQVFVDSREGKTLTFDSREHWQGGSV